MPDADSTVQSQVPVRRFEGRLIRGYGFAGIHTVIS